MILHGYSLGEQSMEIAPGIHYIQKARGPNLYLLVDEDLTLIDTGYPGNGHIVVEYIEGLGRRVEELKRVLITHSHPDHTGSVAELKELAPVQVMAHPADTSLDGHGRHLISYLNVFGAVPLPIPFLRRIVADGFLEEGQVLPILGDMVVNSGQYVGGSMPFPKTDMRLYEKSLRRLAELDFDIACLAHGQVFNGNADQRIRRMLDWYLKAPMWLRLLRALPSAFRLGRQSGFKES